MNVFEERGVKHGDYVEFTVTTNAIYKYDGVTVDSVHHNTYKGKFDRMESGRIILEGAFPLTVDGKVTLDVIEPAREIGWYEVDQIGTSLKRARYWNGFGWSFAPGGETFSVEFENMRVIGR